MCGVWYAVRSIQVCSLWWRVVVCGGVLHLQCKHEVRKKAPRPENEAAPPQLIHEKYVFNLLRLKQRRVVRIDPLWEEVTLENPRLGERNAHTVADQEDPTNDHHA